MELTVMGSLPDQFFFLVSMPLAFEMPLRTSLTRSDLRTGTANPVVTCNCLTPAKYEFMVLHFNFFTLASQSTKIRVCLSEMGKLMSVLVSRLHFFNMVSAVLYVHQVFLVIAKFPQLATDLAISGGNWRFFNDSSEQRPAVPYLELPFKGVGRKPNE
jgi:hypothetical protein